MPAGILGKGTTITWCATVDGTYSSAISNVGSISGPTASSEFIDVTNQGSASKYREFIAGVIDPGELTFPVNYDPAAADHQLFHSYLESQVVYFWKLTFSDSASTTCIFPGVVTGCEVSAPVDGAITMNVTIKVTGDIDWPGAA